jgi:hypothetical protein
MVSHVSGKVEWSGLLGIDGRIGSSVRRKGRRRWKVARIITDVAKGGGWES